MAPPTDGIPSPLPSDADEVVWALQTSATLWGRGERQDALAWLRRAAEAAIDATAVERGAELARLAGQLERDLGMRKSRADATAGSPPPSGPPPMRGSMASISHLSGAKAAAVISALEASAGTPVDPWMDGESAPRAPRRSEIFDAEGPPPPAAETFDADEIVTSVPVLRADDSDVVVDVDVESLAPGELLLEDDEEEDATRPGTSAPEMPLPEMPSRQTSSPQILSPETSALEASSLEGSSPATARAAAESPKAETPTTRPQPGPDAPPVRSRPSGPIDVFAPTVPPPAPSTASISVAVPKLPPSVPRVGLSGPPRATGGPPRPAPPPLPPRARAPKPPPRAPGASTQASNLETVRPAIGMDELLTAETVRPAAPYDGPALESSPASAQAAPAAKAPARPAGPVGPGSPGASASAPTASATASAPRAKAPAAESTGAAPGGAGTLGATAGPTAATRPRNTAPMPRKTAPLPEKAAAPASPAEPPQPEVDALEGEERTDVVPRPAPPPAADLLAEFLASEGSPSIEPPASSVAPAQGDAVESVGLADLLEPADEDLPLAHGSGANAAEPPSQVSPGGSADSTLEAPPSMVGAAVEAEPTALGGSPVEAPRASHALDSIPPLAPSVLEAVPELTDLPDDERVRFASGATLTTLQKDDEVGSFSLALVLRGSVDVCATISDAPAQRLDAGAILRARGSLEVGVPLRLVCASEEAEVATWDEDVVTAALKSCPWVEEELRRTADRAMALAGATLGPLGDRLDELLRRDVYRSFEVRTLLPNDVLVRAGDPMPGIVVLGAGSLRVLDKAEKDAGPALTPGDFLYRTEILGRAPSEVTAQAGPQGALVLVAERKHVQELVVTCPPLLEILSGG